MTDKYRAPLAFFGVLTVIGGWVWGAATIKGEVDRNALSIEHNAKQIERVENSLVHRLERIETKLDQLIQRDR